MGFLLLNPIFDFHTTHCKFHNVFYSLARLSVFVRDKRVHYEIPNKVTHFSRRHISTQPPPPPPPLPRVNYLTRVYRQLIYLFIRAKVHSKKSVGGEGFWLVSNSRLNFHRFFLRHGDARHISMYWLASHHCHHRRFHPYCRE